MKRRDFIKSTLLGAASASLTQLPRINVLARETASVEKSFRWYKGNIHSHSQWSDGLDLPEVVVGAYKKNGYDFFSLTDHNIMHKEELRFTGFAMNYTPSDLNTFDGESSFWKRVAPSYAWPNLVEEHIKKAQELYGEDSVVIKETSDGKYVRMKTDKELREQFDEPGRFLLLPGFEMTAQNIHVNLINVDKDFFMEDSSMSDLIVKLYDASLDLYGDPEKNPYLFTVNHPLWQFYNIQPTYLFSRPNIRFLEVTNNNTSWAYLPEAWTPEQLWDVVNAHRAKYEQPALLATGTDDSHGVFRPDYKAFHSWTCVYSDVLDARSITDAMKRGRSYISTGLELERIEFDGKTLAVKVASDAQDDYVIDFIGTKKDFDETYKVIETGGDDAKTPARKVECWSKEIGRVLESVEGREASYTLKSDDLYVRAKVYRKGAGCVDHGTAYKISPLTADSAWTQPYRSGEIF